MPTTHKLQIGTWNLIITNLSKVEKKFETCDKDGKVLDYVPGKVERGYYVNPDTNEPVLKTYKLVNGKPFDKLKRTEIVEKYKETEAKEVEDLIEEHNYYVENVPEDLMTKLKAGKAIKFIYTPGGSFNSYYGYLNINEVTQRVLMTLGTTFKSEQVNDIAKNNEGKKKMKEITLQQDGIERVQAEDLMVL